MKRICTSIPGIRTCRRYRTLAIAVWSCSALLLGAGLVLASTPTQAQTFVGLRNVSQVSGNHLEAVEFNAADNDAASASARVYGADLGAPFRGADGTWRFFFGDTFGPDGANGFRNADRRSNIMATTQDMNAANGINLNFVTDASGQAREIIPVFDQNIGMYPTTGWSDPSTGREWAAVAQIEIASWTSVGNQIWTTSDGWQSAGGTDFDFMQVPGTANFEQVYAMAYGGYFYFYGAKLNRTAQGADYTTGIQVMRIQTTDMVAMTAGGEVPEIWTDCNTWNPVDSLGICTPKDIVDGPAADGSVMYHPAFEKFLAIYLDPTYLDGSGRIRMCWADQPQGNASTGKCDPDADVLICGNCGPYDNCYAPYLLPEHTSGKTAYFLMSRMVGAAYMNGCEDSYYCMFGFCSTACHQVYNVFLLEMQLQ